MTQRIISVLLTALMLCGSLVLASCSMGGKAIDSSLKFEETSGHYECIIGKDASGDITIPGKYNGKRVNTVKAENGEPLTDVTSLTLEEEVYYIVNCNGMALKSLTFDGDVYIKNSFNDCGALETLTLGENGVDYTVKDSFCRCTALKEVRLSDGQYENSFADCPSISELSLASGKNYTDFKNCFNQCSIEKADLSGEDFRLEDSFTGCEIKESLTLSGKCSETNAFNQSKIKKAVFDSENTKVINSFAGSEIDEGVTFSNKVTEISGSFCKGKIKSVNFQQEVEKISSSFQSDKQLKSVFIQMTCSITGSFTGCPALKSVEVAENGETQEEGDEGATHYWRTVDFLEIIKSFKDCTVLSDVRFHEKVTDVEDSFINCPALKEIKADDGFGKISGSFKKCGLKEGSIRSDEDAENEKREKEYEEWYEENEKQKEEKRKQQEKEDATYGPGTSYLQLSAPADRYACYKLIRTDGEIEFQILLGPGESITRSFPCGKYTLKIAEGDEWISDDEAFGSSGKYSSTNLYKFEAGASYEISSNSDGPGAGIHGDSANGFTG